MGFNFGAFAGGLATSIQKQQELNLQDEKYQQEIKNAQDKLLLESQKLTAETEKLKSETASKLQTALVKQEDVMLDTKTSSEQKINSYNNISKIYGIDKAKGLIKDPNSGESYILDIPYSQLGNLDNIQKELEINKGNGTYKLDNTGALFTRDTADSDWKPITKGSNSKIYDPKDKEDYSFGVIDGKEGYYSKQELSNATAKGLNVERSKDKPSQTTVNIKNQEQDFNDAFKIGKALRSGEKVDEATLAEAQAKVMASKFGESNMVKKVEEDTRAMHQNLSSLKDLQRDINKIASDPMFENQYKTLWNEAITKYVPENFYSLSDSDREAAYQSLRAKGAMGDALAKYLKANSGTAASEKEAMRNFGNMFGTDNISLVSPKAIKNSFDSFVSKQENTAKINADKASQIGLVSNANDIYNVINSKPNEPQSGKKKSLSEIFK